MCERTEWSCLGACREPGEGRGTGLGWQLLSVPLSWDCSAAARLTLLPGALLVGVSSADLLLEKQLGSSGTVCLRSIPLSKREERHASASLGLLCCHLLAQANGWLVLIGSVNVCKWNHIGKIQRWLSTGKSVFDRLRYSGRTCNLCFFSFCSSGMYVTVDNK